MLPFKLVYSNDYYLPIGVHVFPAQKYRYIHQRLLETGVAEPSDFLEPSLASDEDVLLVHTPEYVHKLKTGTLSAREELQMEVPYSPELVRAFYLAAGGSILAGQSALRDKVAFNIGGGFHHAFPDHGEGFCVIHDVAVAIRRLQRDKKIVRAMTVDCDVHQGNGTAAIFGGIREVNDPLPSKASVTGTADDDYLAWLDNALSSGLRQFEPELICYIAGADPYREDQLGGLALTIEGLKRRDELMFRVARTREIPVMVTFAGGYARRVEDTVTIHCNTVIAAKEVFGT
ncbi:MAG: histone deacetylase [Acidobacteriales bacterium 13_2_20CM_2_55_5]|nr:MAG: histone deacetylase [Acidobacteriales bacterium 13_2_20CM_2_55_5]